MFPEWHESMKLCGRSCFWKNREALSRELSTLIENLGAIQTALDAEDENALKSLLRKGREVKESLGE